MSEGRIYHGTHNQVEILRYEGEIRHTVCVALDGYLSQLFKQDELLGFVVDLSDVESIDSTNLGILARLAREMQKRKLPKITLISGSEDINELLHAVGFETVFHIVAKNDLESGALQELPSVMGDEHKMQQIFLDSHRELMELNSQNRAVFRDVVTAFEREMANR